MSYNDLSKLGNELLLSLITFVFSSSQRPHAGLRVRGHMCLHNFYQQFNFIQISALVPEIIFVFIECKSSTFQSVSKMKQTPKFAPVRQNIIILLKSL